MELVPMKEGKKGVGDGSSLVVKVGTEMVKNSKSPSKGPKKRGGGEILQAWWRKGFGKD